MSRVIGSKFRFKKYPGARLDFSGCFEKKMKKARLCPVLHAIAEVIEALCQKGASDSDCMGANSVYYATREGYLEIVSSAFLFDFDAELHEFARDVLKFRIYHTMITIVHAKLIRSKFK